MTTPYSLVTYTGNGSTQTFNVPFPYISQAHVEVLLDGAPVPSGVTWDNASTLRLATAPAAGVIVKVQRNTPKTAALVDFQDAGVLTESALDLNTRQGLFIVQEAFDNASALVDTAVAAAVAAAQVAGRSVPTATPSDVGRVLVGRAGDTYGWSANVTITEGTGAVSAGSLSATGAVSAGSLSATGEVSAGGNVTIAPAPTLAGHATRKDYVDTAIAGRAPVSHTHTAVHISDSGAAGRAAIQATDQAALRLAAGIARTVVDRVYAEYTAFAATSAVIPLDDTIPQRTEGFEVMSVTIAPKSPTNRLRIRASVVGANNTGVSWTTLAVFSSLSLDAIQAVPLTQPAPEHSQQFVCEVEFVPGVTAPVTISARVGVVNGTHIFRLNGNVTGRYMGGTSRCTLIVEELTP